MNKRLFVGNLPWSVEDNSLKGLFAEFGEVVEATVAKDKFNGRSRGYGFVEMSDEETAKKAVEGLNGKEVDGRNITVDIARPRKDASDRH